MTKNATHPTLPWSMTFDSTTHTYRDQTGRIYTSVTALVSSCFPPFDAAAAASRIAARTGELELDIIARWNTKGRNAADNGHTAHAYAEALIKGTTPPTRTTAREKQAFAMVDKALPALARQYEFLGAEEIIFDPLYLVAGTIDLPARNRSTGAIAIMDWKTCEDITADSYRRTALPPIQHVPDSKLSHHTLQLSIYGYILTASEWVDPDSPIELSLIHLPHVGLSPVWRPLEYMRKEAETVVDLNWEAKRNEHENIIKTGV